MTGGVLALIKPPGCSSHDVVALVRRRLGLPAGHLGTLDPLAAGVLVVATGSALRLVRYAGEADKEYRAEILLGASSPTDDLGESPQPVGDAKGLKESEVLAALREIARWQVQTPPSYSARQVQGERAYRAARRGEELDLPAKPAHLREFAVEAFTQGRTARLNLRLRVSAGYYVRSLARDLGSQLGTGGLLARLVRTRSGQFGIEETQLLEDEWQLLAPETLVPHFPVVQFELPQARRLALGQRLAAPSDADGMYLAKFAGRLFAVVRHADGVWRPDTVIGLEDERS